MRGTMIMWDIINGMIIGLIGLTNDQHMQLGQLHAGRMWTHAGRRSWLTSRIQNKAACGAQVCTCGSHVTRAGRTWSHTGRMQLFLVIVGSELSAYK
jgi:hypothetical protein